MKSRSQAASLGLFIASMLVLTGCADHALPARPSLLNREVAAVSDLDWVAMAGMALVLPTPPGDTEKSTVQVASCRVASATVARPRLVIEEPACASFFVSDEQRID